MAKVDLEGRFYWLYNILMDLKIMRMDCYEDNSNPNEFCSLVMKPKWFWEK